VKGFGLLLAAFFFIAHKHPSWSLEIWGEGPLRSALETLACKLGLAARVRFPGFAQQPYEVLQQADLFVLSSHFEGFGNVLCEAMACGLPVVSFASSGPCSIIRDGIDGVLVASGDGRALVATLDLLMRDEAQRQRLARRAPEVLERFGIERVMGMWEQLL
jgi:glycosyltransferase involved in cell wall biosynthesis